MQFLPDSVKIASELGANLKSNYKFDPTKVSQDLRRLSQIDSSQQSQAQIQADMNLMQDLVFDFLPELIRNLADHITTISELGIVARHKMSDSLDIHHVLDKFSQLKKPALVQGMSAVEVIRGSQDRIHKLESKPNGIDIQDQRVRTGEYDLLFDKFPRSSIYEAKHAKESFGILERALFSSVTKSDESISQLLKNANSRFDKNSQSAQFFTGAFFDLYKKSLEALDNLNQFVIELRKNLPQDMQKHLTQKIKEQARIPLIIAGSAVFRLVTDPTQVYETRQPKAPTGCPMHVTKVDNPSQGFTRQQRP